MILHGNSRAGARDLALHLLKDENDHVTVHELRGFISDTLPGAFDEVRAISRGTKAKQYLFSLSLNPPANEKVSTQAFELAIEQAEDRLGLNNQPRAIVFHEKNGRRHAHVVWSRIDGQRMKAIPVPHSKRKLMTLSRELYFEHGWTMPEGFIDRNKRSLDNFTMAQWQQAKRTHQRPEQIKQTLRDCWSTSKTQAQLEQRLKDYGYTLSQGSRRAIVVLDQYCEVYALPRWLGLKTKTVKEKVTAPENLPAFEESKTAIARTMQQHLQRINDQRQQAVGSRIRVIEEEIKTLTAKHRKERRTLEVAQQQRRLQETKARQSRYNKGLRGLWDRITGKHQKLKAQLETEAYQSAQRDQSERDQLIFQQLEARQTLQQRISRLQSFDHKRGETLSKDQAQYLEIEHGRQDRFDHILERGR